MKPKKIAEFLRANFRSEHPLPVFLRGSAGVGKTSLVISVMTELGYEVRTLIASTLDPVDVRGIPRITDRMLTEWFPPGFFDVKEGEKVAFFFDELNAAPHSVQVAFYRIILEGKLDNLDISKCPRIGAGNKTTDRAIVNRMPSTLVTRFYNIEFDVDVDDWKEWAYRNNIDTKVISFINFRPGILVQPPYSEEKSHGCPRTYEYLSRVMGIIKDIDYEVVAGAVGDGVASEFMGYIRVYDKLPSSAEEIISKKITNREPSIQYAINGILVDWFRKQKKIDTADSIIEYSYIVVPEFSVKLMMDCAMVNAGVLGKSKLFVEWSKKHADVILPGGS